MNAHVRINNPFICFICFFAAVLTVASMTGCGGGGATSAIPSPPVVFPSPSPSSTPAKSPEIPVPTPTPSPRVPLPAPDSEFGTLAQKTEDCVNAERTASGLLALTHSDRLQAVAQAYAERLATENFFSHYDAQGKCVSDRVNAAGYTNWSIVGENLAWVKVYDGTEAEYTTREWMNSPSHRANIVNPEFIEGAIGVAKASDGKYFLVQVFAHPRP